MSSLDLPTVLLLTPLVVFLCYWAGYTVLIVASVMLIDDHDSVLDAVIFGFRALPVALVGSFFLLTMTDGQDSHDCFAER